MKNITTTAMLGVAAWAIAQAPTAIGVTVDGNPLTLETPARQEMGRVLVPMRAIFQSMYADVAYDAATKVVTAKKGEHVTTLNVGSTKAMVDGREITMPTDVKPVDGVIMVPLRFVAESLGAKVDYVAAERMVKIESPPAVDPSTTSGPETVTPPDDTQVDPVTPGTSTEPTQPASPSDPSVPTSPTVAAPPTTPSPGETPKPSPRPITETVASTEAPAETGIDFMKLLPWILGALGLGALAYFIMASRARQGGVIAADTDDTPRP